MQAQQALPPQQSFYEMTAHPDIYKYAYWGQCQVSRDGNSGQGKGPEWDLLFMNRNLFITQYEINAYVDENDRPLNLTNRHIEAPFPVDAIESKLVMDHVECYQSNKKWILICSPYSLTINGFEGAHETLIEYGWRLIAPLYDPSATTYIKVVMR